MPAANFDLIGNQIIEQGSHWEIMVSCTGNLSSARFKGVIKRKYGGDTLTAFKFGSITYNSDTNKSTFLIGLNSKDTHNLPIPADGEFWVYDILCWFPGSIDPIRILKGRVEVDPGVTDG